MYENEFIKIGLNKGEAEIYASLLQFGELSASEIAKRTDIGRTNVYEYAGGLIKRGLISQLEKSNKTFFRAENPGLLKDLVEQRERETRDLSSAFSGFLPKLEDMYNRNINKPLVEYLHGEKGYVAMMEKMYVENSHTEIFLLIADLDDYEPPEPKYRSAKLRRQLFTNLISNKGGSLAEFNKRDKRELRKTAIIPETSVSIKTDTLAFGPYVAFGSFQKSDFSATVIKHTGFARELKSAYAHCIACSE